MEFPPFLFREPSTPTSFIRMKPPNRDIRPKGEPEMPPSLQVLGDLLLEIAVEQARRESPRDPQQNKDLGNVQQRERSSPDT